MSELGNISAKDAVTAAAATFSSVDSVHVGAQVGSYLSEGLFNKLQAPTPKAEHNVDQQLPDLLKGFQLASHVDNNDIASPTGSYAAGVRSKSTGWTNKR